MTWTCPAPEAPLVVSGKVIDADGRPVVRAKVDFGVQGQTATSDAMGAFRFTLQRVESAPLLTIEADGLAAEELLVRRSFRQG